MEFKLELNEDPAEESEGSSGHQDNLENNFELKENVLDLTVHCEPSLIEEDNDDEETESLVLSEECVDPLEFLEVDQKSITESVENDDPQESRDPLESNDPPKINDSIGSNDILKVVIKKESEDSIDNNNQVDVQVKLPPEDICEKCGALKSTVNNSQISSDCDLKNIEKQISCLCSTNKIKCKICRKVMDKSSYTAHMRRHKRARKQTCDICGKTFQSLLHFQKHSAAHAGENSYFCDVCNKQFTLFKTLKEHRVSCTKKKTYYKCSECGEPFPLKRALFNHLKTHQEAPPESFNCEICCIVFDNSSSKKEHIMQVHVAAQRFVCGICGEAFVTECAMKRHTVSHSRSFPCKICSASFNRKRDLIYHNLQHRSDKEVRCKVCDREFEQIAAYTEHKILGHCSSEVSAVCELCNKTFKDKTSLKKHITIHVPQSERSILCDICNKGFCGSAALRKHIRLIHADSRPYTCEFCSKSFNQLCKLKYHIVIHASDKPVTCDICKKAFSNEKDIKIHMRTHTGERPFKCKLCGKSFRQRGHVKTHQLVHTKEKPFNCQLCDKSFGLTSSLKKHMKLHTTKVSRTTL